MSKKAAVLTVALLLFLTPLSVAAQYSPYAAPDSQSRPEQSYGEVSFADDAGVPAKAEGVSNQDVSVQGCSGNYPNYCGGNCWGKCSSGSVFSCYNGQGYCCPSDRPYYWGGKCNKCGESYPKDCGGSCYKCTSSSDVFTCYNNKPYCCSGSYPYYCDRTGGCWVNKDRCDKAVYCNGEWRSCSGSSKPNCVNNQFYCCPSDTPYYRDGGCWKCPADKPVECGGSCHSSSECGGYGSCVGGEFKCCSGGLPYYCSKIARCAKDSEQCSNAVYCGGLWWTCDTSSYTGNCVNGNVYCCPPDKPNYVNGQCTKCPADKPIECGGSCYSNNDCWGYQGFCTSNNQFWCCNNNYPYPCPRTDFCWPNQERCDTAIYCGVGWWACNDPDDNEKCVDGKGGCCPSGYSYYCPSANTCFKQDGLCDGRPVHNCNGKLWVCGSKEDKGACYGDELRCCPSSYPYWWESDKQCHASPYQQKTCSFPDGSSSECDCNSNSQCPPSKPYCEENYPSPISDGYDACLASEPEYCGNGKCVGSEDYNSCATDCAANAPKGTISVDATYSKGSNANKPISGAYVYLDGSLKGTTDSNGKKSISATYGERTVKVDCPDSVTCGTRTINVDGAKYASFKCNCAVQDGELQIRVRTLHSSQDEGYPIYNAYVFLDNEFKGFTDIFGNLYVSKVSYGSHKLGIALKIANKEGEQLTEHRYSADIVVDEPFEGTTINVVTSSQQQSFRFNADSDLNVLTVSAYNETYVPQTIPIIVVAAVTVGFTAWSYGDYAKCVEQSDSWWGAAGKQLWFHISCNPVGLPIGGAINKDHVGNCAQKAAVVSKNTLEKCGLEGGFLVISFIPGSWITKTLGKFFVLLKDGLYSIPYVERFLGYGFKVIKESDEIIKISDGVREFKYKLIGGSLKLYDNIVGMVAKLMENAEIYKKISAIVDDFLRTAKPADLKAIDPTVNPENIGNVKGTLGEQAEVKTADVAGEEFVKEGATFVRPTGPSKHVYKQSQKYKLQFNAKGKLEPWDKDLNQNLGDMDDFYEFNGKPIVTEVKTMPAANLDKAIKDGLASNVIRRLKAVKDVTGETPEFIIMVPKGEAKGASLANFLNKIRSSGFRAEAIELTATNSEFEKAARRIVDEAKRGG